VIVEVIEIGFEGTKWAVLIIIKKYHEASNGTVTM
jgi:hypothetical protein